MHVHSTGSAGLTGGYPVWHTLRMSFRPAEIDSPKRSGMDTFGLVVLAAAFLFIPLFLVAMVFVWLSNYWTRNEKLFATLLPLGLFAAGWLYGIAQGGFVMPIAASQIAAMVGSLIASFTLAFRSGRRESRLPEPA